MHEDIPDRQEISKDKLFHRFDTVTFADLASARLPSLSSFTPAFVIRFPVRLRLAQTDVVLGSLHLDLAERRKFAPCRSDAKWVNLPVYKTVYKR
jgi:hypothetical protein